VARKTIFAGFAPTRRGAHAKRRLVAVVAFDGVVLGDLATPVEIFGLVRDARGAPCYEVRVCSDRSEVESEHVTLTTPWRLSSLLRAHTVIVPGIDNIDRKVPEQLLCALRAALKHRVRVASICTGAFVLAQTGALDGLEATTHWLVAQELARRHPAIDVNPDVLYVDNGAVLTSAGAAAGMDLCLHLVRRDLGAEVAARTARAVVMPLERSGGQAQYIVYEQPAAAESMAPLLLWIEQNLDDRLSLSVIARHAAMSARTLSRRFVEQVGATPAQWIARARVRRAQQLLETTSLSIEDVAARAGFRSASVLREHFGAILGTPPLAYRRAFGGPGRQ
jgi:transcriptional regulator GlxA family with amidase domain